MKSPRHWEPFHPGDGVNPCQGGQMEKKRERSPTHQWEKHLLMSSFLTLSANPRPLSLLLSSPNTTTLQMEELGALFLSVSNSCTQSPIILFRSFLAFDSNVFLLNKKSLARSFACSFLSTHCHPYLHSIVGSFLLQVEQSLIPTLQNATNASDFYHDHHRESLKILFLDFLEFLLSSLLELQDETKKIFSLLSVAAQEQGLDNWTLRSVVFNLFFSQFVGNALDDPEGVFSFRSSYPGVMVFSTVLGRLLREAVGGQLGWLTEDTVYLKRVSRRFGLMGDYLLDEDLGEEIEEYLRESFKNFLITWETSHHECTREKGTMTCVRSEMPPEEASKKLSLWITGADLREEASVWGEFELLWRVRDLLATASNIDL